MSTDEPFLPFHREPHDDIDAADPGLGAPGQDTPPPVPEAELTREEHEFEEWLDEHRADPTVFRRPRPHDSGR